MNELPWHRLWFELTAADLDVERRQCREEGKDVADLHPEFERLQAADLTDPGLQEQARRLLDRCAAREVAADFEFLEPSDLDGIRAQRPAAAALPTWEQACRQRRGSAAEQLEARLHAAWTGRAAGCLLGKPVEGWRTPKLHEFLRATGSLPLRGYLRRGDDAALQRRFELKPDVGFLDDVDGMPEDDDLNYTVLALALLERHGREFTPRDVATFWMQHLPVLHTCTAERVAYRNFCLGLDPPRSATFRNPYREWIGAQIRGDLFGYVCPGDPVQAAELAWRDACISHVKNGIYGEMWAAAMVAAAMVTDDRRAVVQAGLATIPARCRLAAAVQDVLDWNAQGLTHDDAVERLHRRHDEHHPHDWCHTISNATLVTAALLWGADFGATVGQAVQPGFDTDCNGATAGSVRGALLGDVARLGAEWTAPLKDTLHTGVAGFERVSLRDLARRTARLVPPS